MVKKRKYKNFILPIWFFNNNFFFSNIFPWLTLVIMVKTF